MRLKGGAPRSKASARFALVGYFSAENPGNIGLPQADNLDVRRCANASQPGVGNKVSSDQPGLSRKGVRPRVLIAEDSPVYQELLRYLLAKWEFDLHFFTDGLEAWNFLQSEDVPTIAILDWMMPGLDGIEVCRSARSLERKHYLYILLVTGKDGTDSILEGIHAGADDYLTKPFDPAVLVARMFVAERILGFQQNLVAARQELAASEERYRNLVENSTALICTHDLEGRVLSINPAAARALGYTVEQCIGRNVRESLIPEAQAGFDVYLAQIGREQVATGNMALIARNGERLIWSYTNRFIQAATPYVLGHAQDVTEQVRLHRALRKTQAEALAMEKKLSRTDPLTGLANRRAFYEITDAERRRAARYSRPLSLAYIDLDNFKQVNDQLGHEAGDQLLICVGQVLQASLRGEAHAARLGGDEFALLLPEADLAAAKLVIARVHGLLTEAMQEQNWPVTFSIGLVTFSAPVETTDVIIRAADQLMYKVKREGKNRIASVTVGPDNLLCGKAESMAPAH